MYTLRLCMIRVRSLWRHLRRGVISETRVSVISRHSNCLKSSATISKPWLLNSVWATLRDLRLLRRDSETITAIFDPSTKVPPVTSRLLRFLIVHSLRQFIKSLIVTFNWVASKSTILCWDKVRLRPFLVSKDDAEVMGFCLSTTCSSLVFSELNTESVLSSRVPASTNTESRCSDRLVWRYRSPCLKVSMGGSSSS